MATKGRIIHYLRVNRLRLQARPNPQHVFLNLLYPCHARLRHDKTSVSKRRHIRQVTLSVRCSHLCPFLHVLTRAQLFLHGSSDLTGLVFQLSARHVGLQRELQHDVRAGEVAAERAELCENVKRV